MNNDRLESASVRVHRVSQVPNFVLNKNVKSLYIKNSEYRNLCDSTIRDKIVENLNNDNYDIEEYLEYANRFIYGLIEDKPYLIEFDIIIETLIDYMDDLKEKYGESKDELERQILLEKKAKTIILLGKYRSEFSHKFEINHNKEIELTLHYDQKRINNDTLNLEETEELICMYLSGSIKYKKEEFLNFIFKTIIENGYVVKESLYKKIFLAKCTSIMEKEDVNVNIYFSKLTDRFAKPKARYSFEENSIRINSDDFCSNNTVDNFVSFFHEKRHYYHHHTSEAGISELSFAKDMFLKDVLGMGYYNKNYADLSFEKDAFYSSLKDIYYFILEVAPSMLEDVKEYIYKKLVNRNKMTSDEITERIGKIDVFDYKEVENFNLLFERTVKKEKDSFLIKTANGSIPLVLLYEYDLNGNKKDLFELLSERELLENKKENSKKIHLYDYLIYDEEVSLNYILKNIMLLSKNKSSEHYEEIKKIIKQKLLNYYTAYNRTKVSSKVKNDDEFLLNFYKKELEKLESIEIKGMKRNVPKSEVPTKSGELRKNYELLFSILGEMDEDVVKKR